MKCWKGTKLFLLMIFVCGLAFILNDHPQQVVNATDIRTFYVSNTGDDHSDGLSANHPWRSLDKVESSTFQPGDRILFDANSVWNGQLILDGAKNGQGATGNPITIGSYNQGNTGKKAIINGLGTTADKSSYHERKLSNLNLMTGTIELWNANNWTISNLEVTNQLVAVSEMLCVSVFWLLRISVRHIHREMIVKPFRKSWQFSKHPTEQG